MRKNSIEAPAGEGRSECATGSPSSSCARAAIAVAAKMRTRHQEAGILAADQGEIGRGRGDEVEPCGIMAGLGWRKGFKYL